MSLCYSPLTLAACLEAADLLIGRPLDVAVNEDQLVLLSRLPAYLNALPHLKQWLWAFAAPTAEQINAELAAAGFDISLEAWTPSAENFGVAGVLDAHVVWPSVADVTSLVVNGHLYEGFVLKRTAGCLVLSLHTGGPLVLMPGQDGLELRLQVMHRAPESIFELTALAFSMVSPNLIFGHDRTYDGAILPMVRLEQRPDISWLLGLKTATQDGAYWEIAQALQQVQFGLNQHGARAREATAVQVVERSAAPQKEPRYYQVDGPFVVTIVHQDTGVPLFAAYVTPEDWRNPGHLTTMTSW